VNTVYAAIVVAGHEYFAAVLSIAVIAHYYVAS
jgi:hypothetical protein